jgi:predicted outer membrane repeat protein
MSWAWADGTTPLTTVHDTVSVQISIHIDAPFSGKRSVVVSSETIGIGIAGASIKSSNYVFLSLRAGDSAFVDIPECMLQVGVWNTLAVSFSFSRTSPGYLVPTVYLNWSWVNVTSLIPISEGFALAMASESGLAVGRDFPSAEYLINVSTLGDDSSSYFFGSFARLRLWGGAASNTVSLNSNQTCQELSTQEGLIACYDFNRSLEDFMHKAGLHMRAGDRYRPWCTTIDDGGRFIFHPDVNTNVVYDRGELWGFCSRLFTLPSRERSYDPLEMEQTQGMHTADLLARFRGCGRVPLTFINNRAISRHGGAVYTKTYQSAKSRNGTCFLGLPGGPTPALQIVFARNSAGASGGAVYIDNPAIPSSCAEILRQRLGLPSPHADLKVLIQDNVADAWGDAFATQPSRLYVASGIYEYVPGIDAVDLVAELADDLNQTVRGSSSFANPYIVKMLSCVPNASCSDRSSLSHSSFYSCNQSGQCRTKSESTQSSVLCRANRSEAIAMLSYSDLVSIEVVLRCLPCRQGEHIKFQAQQPVPSSSLLVTWSCSTCGAGMTVIEPNNPDFGCVQCPATAVCPNGGPPIFGVTQSDLTILLHGNVSNLKHSSGLGSALTTALFNLLPLVSQEVSLLQACATDAVCEPFRRAQNAQGQGLTITLRILQETCTVSSTALVVSSQEWRRNLSDWLVNNGLDLAVVGVQTAVISTRVGLGEWVVVGGTFLLKSCPAGYLVVNSDREEQHCHECDAGTYSINSTDGCIGGICSLRPCTQCPAGASCAKGSSSSWSHFVPRVLMSGSGPILSVTLVLPRYSYTLFYIDSPARYIWTNASLLPTQSEPEYEWEFVANCTVRARPCDPRSSPSFVLRVCPPGHTIENSSRSLSEFNQALQDCVPCAAGQYVIRPSLPPCLDCPFGGRCEAGIFKPSVLGSVWEEAGNSWRIRLCPPGYVLVR